MAPAALRIFFAMSFFMLASRGYAGPAILTISVPICAGIHFGRNCNHTTAVRAVRGSGVASNACFGVRAPDHAIPLRRMVGRPKLTSTNCTGGEILGMTMEGSVPLEWPLHSLSDVSWEADYALSLVFGVRRV